MPLKRCIKCGEEKPETSEYFHKNRNDLIGTCKVCKAGYMSTYRNVNKETISDYQRNYYFEHKEENKARKSECQKAYVAANKDRVYTRNKEYRDKNKDKIKARNKENYHKNKAENILKAKEYYHKNKGRILERVKARYQSKCELIANYKRANSVRLNIRRRAYMADRRANDIYFKLTKSLRTRVRDTISRGRKSAKSLELLGCTVEYYKEHLERQFKPGMTWDNYGTYWHIDHIRPCASFDLTDPEQQKQCFNFSNLQPLEAKENIIKGAKWSG